MSHINYKIKDGKVSEIKDEIFDLDGIAEVKVDGVDILPENVFVIKSFESFYESNSIINPDDIDVTDNVTVVWAIE